MVWITAKTVYFCTSLVWFQHSLGKNTQQIFSKIDIENWAAFFQNTEKNFHGTIGYDLKSDSYTI